MHELEKYGDDEYLVRRTKEGKLEMIVPGSHEVKPYDGRFGELPPSFQEEYFHGN